MKKILLATVAALGMASVASAADLPARMPVKAPPVIAPVFSWTGCYIGGYVGGAWSDGDISAYDRNGYSAVGAWGYKTDASFIGGGTLGCNYQPVGSPFVLGLEGELGYLNIKGSAYDPLLLNNAAVAPGVASSTKIGNWYGIVAGRLGYSFDRALIYVKGGAAFVNVQNSVFDGFGLQTINASASETVATWTVGGGIEWAFDMNWSVKAEYMYIALNNQTVSGINPGDGLRYNWDHDNSGISTAKIGLNYRFGGGAPLVARY
ncbi:MAG: porin family protein [Rhodoplanes sp.]|uniref:outer membrane protein n=1 Tax=Rhodoplanes sp. TaxID=1968906 RepID=UPI0017F0240D|nr:outer membrane beta-barrel protein [Rhodoplanes sp.]NVO17099.1 porin family protein [Rhodoplanes sp.]